MVNRLILKLIRRELKGNWFQYLSMLVITFLAVTLFLGFVSNTVTLRARTDMYMEDSHVASLIAQTTSLGAEDADFFAQNFAETDYRIFSEGAFSVRSDNPSAIQSTHTAKFFITDGEAAINRPYVVEGEAGLMIDKSVADLFGYKLGDRVTADLSTYSSYLAMVGVESLEFTITGFMYSVEGVNIYDTSPVFITAQTFWQTLTSNQTAANMLELLGIDRDGLFDLMRNQALVRTDDVEVARALVNDHFNAKQHNNLVFLYDRDSMESVVVLDTEADQSLTMLYVFPVIFFLVAVLVIMTTIGRLILRERTNVGTMKALGISNGRIVALYASLGGVVTFIGACLGAVAGPLIVPTVMNIKYGLIYSMPMLCGTLFSPLWTAVVIAVVTAAAVLIGIGCSRSIIKERPAECMRPKQIVYAPKKVIGGPASGGAALTLRMGLRNILINKRRALMTVLGITGCMALLLTSFGIGDTVDASVYNDYGGLFNYDVMASYSPSSQGQIEEYLAGLEEDGEVTAYQFNRTYAATAATEVNKTVAVYVMPKSSPMTAVMEGGCRALSKSVADDLGVGVGDKVTFTIGTCSVEYIVGRIVQTTTRNGFYITETENEFTDDCYYTAEVWLTGADAEGLRDKLLALDGVASASTMAEQLAEIRSLINSVDTMRYTVMVFAIALSVVVLYNLSLLNLKERNRDMATLKVLGFTNSKIALTLFVEVFTLTVIGTLIGALLGFPLLYLVMKINELPTIAFIYSLKPLSYVLAALISLGTGAVINAFFSAAISKVEMTSSLKSVE